MPTQPEVKQKNKKKRDILHIIVPLPPQFLHADFSFPKEPSIMSAADALGVHVEEPEIVINPRVVHKQERHLRLEGNLWDSCMNKVKVCELDLSD